MRLGVGLLLAVAACGRINFDPLGGPSDAPRPAGHVLSVLHGETVIGLSVDVTLPRPVDPAHSFLVFGYRLADAAPRRALIHGQLAGSDQLHFERFASTRLGNIQWYVIEGDDNVEVQRGTRAGDGDLAIAPIDPPQSFVLASWANTGAFFNNDDFVRVGIRDAQTLDVVTGTDVLDWQVVQFSGAHVQHGLARLTGLSLSLPIEVVPLDRTWLTTSWRVLDPDDGNSIGPDIIDPSLDTSSSLVFARDVPGDPIDVAYQVVTLPPGGQVATETQSFPAAVAIMASDIGLSPWDVTRTCGMTTAMQSWGSTTYTTATNGSDDPGVALFTIDVTQMPTLAVVAREVSVSMARVTVQAIEWP